MIDLPQEPGAGSLVADLTPLLDVIFIVLVFLLLTANTPLLEIPVALPDSDAAASVAQQKDSERAALVLHADGHWQLAEESFASWPELQTALQKQLTSPPLDVAVEKGAPATPLLKLLAWLNAAERSDTRLLMEQSDAE
ncbi:MAG: biopolymer transporter ExbD [Pseudomonas neustonica]